MNTRRSVKRTSQSPKPELPIGEDTFHEKRRKVGRKGNISKNTESVRTKPIQNNSENSSDSSSDEFERPPPLSELDLGTMSPTTDSNKLEEFDFTAIEDNILTGVTRLSESDESDFDEVPEPSSFLPPIKPEKTEDSAHPCKSASGEVNGESKSNENGQKGKRASKGKRSSKTASNSTSLESSKNNACLLTNDTSKMDIAQLLALGEGLSIGSSSVMPKVEMKPQQLTSESDLSDWENVEGLEEAPVNHTIPEEGVEVKIEMPEIYRKRKKKGFDWEGHLKRRLNRVKRELQVLMHKVHLLCWIAHGQYVNTILNSDVLMGISLSLIPSQHCCPPKYTNLNYLEQIVQWFAKTIVIKEVVDDTPALPLCESLQEQFHKRAANSRRDLVLMFICLLRALGIKSRLLLSLQPLPLKPSSEDLCSVNKPKSKRSSTASETPKAKTENSVDTDIVPTKLKESVKKEKDKPKSPKERMSPGKNPPISKSEETPSSSQTSHVRRLKRSTILAKERKSKKNTPDKNDVSIEKMEKLKKTLRERKEVANKYKEHSDSSNEEAAQLTKKKGESVKKTEDLNKEKRVEIKNNSSKQKVKIKENGISRPKSRTPETSNQNSTKTVISKTPNRKGKSASEKIKVEPDENSDSDFEPASFTQKKCRPSKNVVETIVLDSDSESEKKVSVSKGRASSSKKMDRRVLSSDSEDDPANGMKKKKKKGLDVWTEVFLEEEEQWISVDVPTAKLHCVAELHSRASQPVSYVLAFNNDLTLKDVTCRYCVQFATITRKLRVDEEWWKESLEPFHTARNARDREEDEELNRLMLDRPLPTTMTELKNHPLYAIKDHLLKFEAIYPPDAPPLGYIKGKPIYARECVHTLHSREVWLREAKVVRLGEQPYKIVKARPKYDKMTGNFVKDLPLEIFGSWQVEDYMPPVAVDGKVPRNEYGNVELFKACMLPKGTVHLPIPGLNRVARKLGIDCAPAMIGFDFHSGGCHPLFDGFVVCEEYKDTMLDAWNQEQDEAKKRQQEKYEKRVYGNWKRLIRGLLIREKLKLRYSFGDEAGPSEPRLPVIGNIIPNHRLTPNIRGTSKNRKTNISKGQKRNSKSPGKSRDQKGKQKGGRKKRKVESEEEEEEDDESEEEDEDFGSDKDWD